MNITKETIILYLLDRLNAETSAEVEAAICKNDELHAFYSARLEDLRAIRDNDRFAESEELEDYEEEVDSDMGSEAATDQDEFDQYIGLAPEEAARRFLVGVLEKRVMVEPTAERNLIRFRSLRNQTSGNRAAASDQAWSVSQQNVANGAQAEVPSWEVSADQKSIILSLGLTNELKRLRIHVTFELVPEDSRQRQTYEAGIVSFEPDPKDQKVWNGVINLVDLGLEKSTGTILNITGIVNE